MNTCPVCGYAMRYPATDFHICPSCGTEFGYDDCGTTYEELRQRWLLAGPEWWSPVDQRPPHWNPHLQLLAGLTATTAVMFQGDPMQLMGVPAWKSIQHKPAKRKRARRYQWVTGLDNLTAQGAIAS